MIAELYGSVGGINGVAYIQCRHGRHALRHRGSYGVIYGMLALITHIHMSDPDLSSDVFVIVTSFLNGHYSRIFKSVTFVCTL